jgi:hypothetical protein
VSTEHPALIAAGSFAGGTDIVSMLEATRAHELAASDAMRENAADVGRGITHADKWPYEADKRLAALAMRLAIRRVANAAEHQARAASVALGVWQGLTSDQARPGRNFDPTS